MKKNRAQKDILYVSISSFVLVVLWIGFNLYHAYVTSTIAPDLQLEIQPIDPTFNTEIIKKLKAREKIAPIYEFKNATPEASVTPLPTTQVIPNISGSPAPTGSIERLGQ